MRLSGFGLLWVFLGSSLLLPLPPVSGFALGSCDTDKLQVPYSSGLLTLDGTSTDWAKVKPSVHVTSPLYDDAGSTKSAVVRVTHDGMNAFFLVQFDANYRYSSSNSSDECPVVSLTLQIGQDATAYDLGGCSQCTNSGSYSACVGREVDLVTFSLCGTIPGRLYSGKNSQLLDKYAYHTSCIGLDGTSIGEILQSSSNASTLASFQETQKQFNEWQASWSHSSLSIPVGGYLINSVPVSILPSIGPSGTYTVEFMRALRTEDELRQDSELSLSANPLLGVGINLKLPTGTHAYYRSCDWHELTFQAPLFTVSTVYQVTANTVLATVFPVVTAVVLTIILCVYVRSYVTHVRREFNMRQRLYDLRRGNESDENKDNTPPDEMHVA